MDIVDIVAELTGMSYNASESVTVTVLVLIVAALLRVLYTFVRQDSEQTKMESRLVTMAGNMLEENTQLREAYQKNVLVIEEHTAILRGIQQVLSTLSGNLGIINTNVTDIKDNILQDIYSSFLKNSKTTFIVKDADEEIALKVTITPDEEGSLVIRFIE